MWWVPFLSEQCIEGIFIVFLSDLLGAQLTAYKFQLISVRNLSACTLLSFNVISNRDENLSKQILASLALIVLAS